jgi:hypothetical protein
MGRHRWSIRLRSEEVRGMEPIFYTVREINGDYAELVTDGGQEHSITMFLLPEGTTVGSRLKLENFQWELLEA